MAIIDKNTAKNYSMLSQRSPLSASTVDLKMLTTYLTHDKTSFHPRNISELSAIISHKL